MRFAADGFAGKYNCQHHCFVAIWIPHEIIRAALHADYPLRDDRDACFFKDLADYGVGWLLTGINRATRQSPATIITAALQENFARVIEHHARRSGHE